MKTRKKKLSKIARKTAGRKTMAWVKPAIVRGTKAYGSGCSSGDEFYVKCDSGGQGDL